ncbi:MAG: exodeoxyribonuclease III [Erysipelotrichaceae bacterium]|jgi:exodeoxyribonuclease-3|nr:exodeoxyribonuclease III [Erysipelotrichaceae bacterium]
MKLISWNVNGIRAAANKGFLDFFRYVDADIFALQETKCREGDILFDFADYYEYWHSADKKGYSGTAVFTKEKPLAVSYNFDVEEHSHEGRVITCEYDKFFFVCCYTPNSQDGLARIDYRMRWEDDFRNYLLTLDKQKPVIVCGDLNVAHNEIDIKNPASNHKNPGFSDQEREKMTVLLNSGFTDTFRYLYPDKKDAYSWWSYRANARANNTGWRIDYFLASSRIEPAIREAEIYSDVYGSDHCPVSLEIDEEKL